MSAEGGEKVMVLYNYSYSDDQGPVEIEEGDVYRLVERTNSEWWHVCPLDAKNSPSTEDDGFFVPAQYVRLIEKTRDFEAETESAISSLDDVLEGEDGAEGRTKYANTSVGQRALQGRGQPPQEGSVQSSGSSPSINGMGKNIDTEGDYVNLDQYRAVANIPKPPGQHFFPTSATEDNESEYANLPYQQLPQGMEQGPRLQDGHFVRVLVEGLPWDIYEDQSRRRFFYNRETEELTWKPPRKDKPSSPVAAGPASAAPVQPPDSPTTPAPQTSDNGTHKVTEKLVQLKVVVLTSEPFVMRSPEGFEGIFIDVLDEIKRRANLTYTIEASPDDSYGYERPTGNWTGLIGQLQSKKADLAVAPLTVFSKRANIVHFTYPVMSSGLRILYKVPDPWSEREAFSILLSPFTPGLWVVLLLMFIATSVFFYVIGRFSPYEDHAFVGKAATYEGLTLLNSFLYTFTSLTFQGYTAAPRSMAGRFLAAFWWMFVLLVIAAYTASLCAIFLSYKPSILSMPFATFDELSQQTHVAYGIVRGGSTEFYLKNSKRKLEKRLWGTINANSENVMAGSVQEGLHRVHSSNGGYAFITEGPVAEYLSGKPPCTLMTVGEELSEHDYAFACRTETDVCDTINKIIIKLREEDFIYEYGAKHRFEYLKQKWMHQGCQRDDTSEYIFQGVAFFDTFGSSPKYFAERAVTLRRFGTGFLVIFIGIVLSGCILVAEIFYAKRRGTAVPQRLPRTGMDDQQRIDREFRDEDA